MDSKGRAGVRNVEGAPRQDRGASRRISDSPPANTSCRTGFHPHLPASIRKTHFCSSIHEFLWHVRLVGPVHLDATISEIGRASCREKVYISVGAVCRKNTN